MTSRRREVGIEKQININNINLTKQYVWKIFCDFLLLIYETRSLYYCSNEIVDCLVWTLQQRWALSPLLSSPCKPFPMLNSGQQNLFCFSRLRIEHVPSKKIKIKEYT